MNESHSNGLGVVLVKDPDCLQRQDACPRSMWKRLKNRVIYSGPSLLAQITYPCSPLSCQTPKLVGVETADECMTMGLKLAREGVHQFRVSETEGCRSCLVRMYDNDLATSNPEKASRSKCGSTCGTIVDFTAETIGSAQIERDGESVMCVTVRLASTKKKIGVKGREQIELLGRAKCLNLDRFDVEPIQEPIDLR